MSKFCGKCGAVLTPQGNCPNCEPNPNQNFANYDDGSTVSFEIPKSQGNTVYAQHSVDNPIDSANIPQNQPPVAYEGNSPLPSSPPVTNIPPTPTAPSPQSGGGARNNSNRRVKRKANWGIITVCILLVICILFVGAGAMMYNEVLYIPNASESLIHSLDNKIYGEERNYFIITDESITDDPIKDDDSAKAAAVKFAKKLGYDDIADELFMEEDPYTTADGYTYYRFQEYYKGYAVVGRAMTLIADKDGNSCGVSTNIIGFDKNFKTDIKDFEKDEVLDALKSLEDDGIEVNVNSYTKSIYSFDHCDKPMMTYEVLAVVNNTNFRIFIDPIEEKIINGYSLDSSNSDVSELEGNGKDMPGNPQHFNGTLHGDTFVMSDPDRKITVYNSDQGTSTIAVVYVDSDKNEYYNRRYNPGHAEYTPNDEVCVVYNEKGEYYEYDKKKGAYVKDDVELKLEDMTEDGYTVFNINSSKSLQPVGSKDKKIDDELAVRLMMKTTQTYDFFKDILGREGYDGTSGTMLAVCNDSLSKQPDKAFSAGDNDGFSMITFGFENPMDWDDVGHEYMHSVEQSISSLIYQNESGAIMEGYSDVFGEIIEDYYNETLYGQGVSEDNFNKNCDWISGDTYLSMPLANQLPEAYMSNFYTEKLSEKDWEDSNMGLKNDFGKVHDNSTVISHLAFLMTMDGDDDTNLSMKELANLWYRTLFLLPSDATFSAFRDCMELQADRMAANKELTEKQRTYITDCFDKANISSVRYSGETGISILADKSDKNFKVKIEGEEFKLFKLKDFSKEYKLTEGEELEDGKYEYWVSLDLKDGRYSIRVLDEDEKTSYFDRDILVMSNSDKMPQYSKENTMIGFSFIPQKEIEMPDEAAAGGDAAVPDAAAAAGEGDIPSDAAGAGEVDIPSNSDSSGGIVNFNNGTAANDVESIPNMAGLDEVPDLSKDKN